jgi:hypothetical protein
MAKASVSRERQGASDGIRTVNDDIEKQLEDIEAMFVQTAREMIAGEGSVTFRGLSPATLFFSDRPEHVVGHLTTKQFVELWGEGENSFAEDPPNAVISFLEHEDETPEDAIVVLGDPRLEGDQITYSVVLLEGNIPARSESCSVFIDPFGRPLSPVSLAGMNRRGRRRERRRLAR